jgi:hypothetical protein
LKLKKKKKKKKSAPTVASAGGKLVKKNIKKLSKIVKSSLKNAKFANFKVEDETCGRIIIIRRR